MSDQEITEQSSIIQEEFDDQVKYADQRKAAIQIFQDKIRSHISTLEAIISNLENMANNCNDPNKKINYQKAASFSFDRLIKFYEIYDKYESTSHRYHASNIDSINKKHTLLINADKHLKQQDTSSDFFRRLNSFLSNTDQSQLSELLNQEPENEEYKL